MLHAIYQQLKGMVFGAEAEAPEKAAGEERRAPPQPQTRYFTGEITSLSGSSGMIDQQVCPACHMFIT